MSKTISFQIIQNKQKAAEKTKLDGLKLDKDLVFETFKKLGSKGKKGKQNL